MPGFKLKDKVAIGDSPVVGEVIGKTEYADHTGYPDNYFVRFNHPQTGLPANEWYSAGQLRAEDTFI